MNALIGQMTLSGLPKIMCGLLKAYYKINLGGGGGVPIRLASFMSGSV